MCRIAPCQNSGICVNGKEGYSCICEKGFTGKKTFWYFLIFASPPCNNYPLLAVKLGPQIRPSRGARLKYVLAEKHGLNHGLNQTSLNIIQSNPEVQRHRNNFWNVVLAICQGVFTFIPKFQKYAATVLKCSKNHSIKKLNNCSILLSKGLEDDIL